jgi:predicted kinase
MRRFTPVLTLVRGLPGSGKSTYADVIATGFNAKGVAASVVSADDFFMRDGVYAFDPKLLGQAHAWCQQTTENLLRQRHMAVVANTFTQAWEIVPYAQMASQYGVRLVIVDCFDGGLSNRELAQRNEHGVPEAAIAAMRARWECDWRAGDPRPPWLRG